jgi:RNA ligase (TIGR02306 family)
MRKLVSIQRITKLEGIPSADKIELATVLGWKVIVQKGLHQENDLVAFCEPDSFLPIDKRYEFLHKTGYKNTPHLGEGYRVKIMKMRGQVSQGLILPLKDLHELENVEIGDLLSVQKYEKPIPVHLKGRISGNFPDFIRKTDQERAQNLVKEITEALEKKTLFEATTKLDGSSMTVYVKDDHVGVCSRNWELDEGTDDSEKRRNAYWTCAREQALVDSVKAAKECLGHNLAFQGELMGPGVQDNRENILGFDFYLYHIWDIDDQRYLTPVERKNLLLDVSKKRYHINHVPVLGVFSLDSISKSYSLIDDLTKYADRPSLNKEVSAEGVVFKAMDSEFSFKIINAKFLLEEKD